MNTTEYGKENPATDLTFATACLASCKKLVAEIAKTRDAILNEFRESRSLNEHLLRLALNEAEGLAWQSGFPQLVFPTLAREKAQAMASWNARQQFIRRAESRLPLAA